MTLSIELLGHACIGLYFDDGPSICLDPYSPSLFGDLNGLSAIDEDFDYCISTHEHADHSSFEQIESAIPLVSPCHIDGIDVSHHEVFHDEFSGKLRGGTTRMTSFRRDGIHILHAGDIGERLSATQQAALKLGAIDVLIIPVGGYFTLGPDAAFCLVSKLAPSWVIPCHGRDHGISLPELGTKRLFVERFPERNVESPIQLRWALHDSGRSETCLLDLTPSRLL